MLSFFISRKNTFYPMTHKNKDMSKRLSKYIQKFSERRVYGEERKKFLNNPVPVSLLSGDRKPQIRFLGNHPSGSGNLYHKSFRM